MTIRNNLLTLFCIVFVIIIGFTTTKSYAFATIVKFEIKHYFQDKPDFVAITNTKDRKIAFFNYLIPEIEKVNSDIMALRKLIIEDKLTAKQKTKLINKYRLQDNASKEDMLEAVDILPPSIIIAQSANESSWGRSRFADKYNNYFGIWCFSKGCGIVPNNRAKGAKHEIAVFDSLKDNIEYYLLNLNRNQAYKKLREVRKTMRQSNSDLKVDVLIQQLTNYSEKRDDYVKSISAIIRQNNLEQYD